MADQFLNKAGLSRLWSRIKAYHDADFGPLLASSTYGPSGLVSFDSEAGGLPLKSCLVNIEPAQEGSGDPSPSNIRPISGRTGARVSYAGKNLLSLDSLNDATINGVTFRVDKTAGTITVNGTATSTVWSFNFGNFKFSEDVIISGCPSGGGTTTYSIQAAAIDGVTPTDRGSGVRIAANKQITSLMIVVRQNYTASNLVFQPMIRLASESDESFEPYQGETIEYAFPTEAGTVYGGTLDVLTGVLTVTHKAVDLGSLSWNYNSSRALFSAAMLSDSPAPIMGGYGDLCKCSSYKAIKSNTLNIYNNQLLLNTSGASSSRIVVIKDTRYTDAATFKAAAAGQTLVYPLAEPITYQLTTELVTTLAGQNTFWADCGDVTVEYGAFLQALHQEIELLFNANQS